MHEKIGLLDISNAWWSQYTDSYRGDKIVEDMIHAFAQRDPGSGIVLFTNTATNGRGWVYVGIPFKKIEHFDKSILYRATKLAEYNYKNKITGRETSCSAFFLKILP